MSANYPLPTPFAHVTIIGLSLAGIAWAIPLAATDALGVTGFRVPAYLAAFTQWRLVGQMTTIAAAGATFRGKYSTTVGGALVDLGVGGDLAADALGVAAGAWTALPAGAIGDMFVTLQGVGGNGITAGVVAFAALQFR